MKNFFFKFLTQMRIFLTHIPRWLWHHTKTSSPSARDRLSISSPQDQREGRIPDISPASLSSFQRSRSRQRALELRTSADAYRSQLHVDNNTGLFATASIEPVIAPLMLDHVDELELVECVHGYNGSCELEESRKKELENWYNFGRSMELIYVDQAIPEYERFITRIDTEQLLRILNNHTNPRSSEEVVDVVQEDHVKEMAVTSVKKSSVKREPLADVKENPNLPTSTSEAEIFGARNPLVSKLVKQKQAAAIATGKKHDPVKALKTAELAKKLAEEKEKKRKMEKIARQAERSRRLQEKLKQMELLKKEEERKKKEADMAARKRQREGGKKDKEPKRKRQPVGNLEKETVDESYPISPYRESYGDDDGIPNRRPIPSWASENCLALAVSHQANLNPKMIFRPKRFCSISEVLMPRSCQFSCLEDYSRNRRRLYTL